MSEHQPDAENAAENEQGAGSSKKRKGNLAALSLGALGVVFGDIGTSPLYALRQCFKDLHQTPVDPHAVLGILCLIFWSLILMVCVKYATFIIGADHDGEGGTLAMLALIHSKRPHKNTVSPGALILLVLGGSALLYGDGVITPAISVLSGVEGLKVAAPGAQHFVVPVALGILVGLFLLQSRGTGAIGNLFGPVMALWFVSIAALGIAGIAQAPQIMQALDPAVGALFLAQHGGTGVVVLGGVVLCFTGAEALFADLSHFGRMPIKLAWYVLVLPSLLLSYFGQGALMLLHPTETHNPFFTLVPHFLLWPVVILATLATVIASQALHEQLLLITIVEKEVPYVRESEMGKVEELGSGLWRVTASFGFMQHPDITRILKSQPEEKLQLNWDKLVCYLPQAFFESKGNWQQRRIQQAYEFLRNNSLSTARYFRVPPREIIHVGVRLEM